MTAQPLALFNLERRVGPPPVAMAPTINKLLAHNAPVAVGVSGGKDSCAVAFATADYLDAIGHAGKRILIHSDLGRVEWADSLPTCHRLADALGWELVVVRRKAGDLMDRWLTRWDNNVARYRALECVKLILPWSTPSMRFCTSELKTAIICRDLVERFPQSTIVSVNGIRREESPNRAKAPISKPQNRLTSETFQTTGHDWHTIIEWRLPDVWDLLSARGFRLHEAYTTYGSSRVSCCFCILGSLADLAASATCPDNHALYQEMVMLEIVSTFGFQDARWLADVAPQLLDEATLFCIRGAKECAVIRERAEARLPKHLLYVDGWPTAIPPMDDARLLADVRQQVAEAVRISDMLYMDPVSIRDRYAELMEIARTKKRKGTKAIENEFVTAPNVVPAGGGRQMQMMIEEELKV